jgi:hypothetical protein
MFRIFVSFPLSAAIIHNVPNYPDHHVADRFVFIMRKFFQIGFHLFPDTKRNSFVPLIYVSHNV